VTHRQYVAWEDWLDRRWDEPDKTEWYLMGIMCQVARVLSKNPGGIQPDQFKMKFSRGPAAGSLKEDKPVPVEEDWRVAASKQNAFMIATGGGQVGLRIVDAHGNLVRRIPSRTEMLAKSREQDVPPKKGRKRDPSDPTISVPKPTKRTKK
jgi:hypothetical protein